MSQARATTTALEALVNANFLKWCTACRKCRRTRQGDGGGRHRHGLMVIVSLQDTAMDQEPDSDGRGSSCPLPRQPPRAPNVSFLPGVHDRAGHPATASPTEREVWC
jgi:hypothetical protein